MDGLCSQNMHCLRRAQSADFIPNFLYRLSIIKRQRLETTNLLLIHDSRNILMMGTIQICRRYHLILISFLIVANCEEIFASLNRHHTRSDMCVGCTKSKRYQDILT